MEADFWHRKWQENDIGFHLSEANPLLVKYFNKLSLPKQKRLFVPLCGKTRDIAWLLANGCLVAGCELNETAVTELFRELDVVPKISTVGKLKHYQAQAIDIFVGDFFNLSSEQLGSVDAVYDRAALVALPESMRAQYTRQLVAVTANAKQLLICFEYDQSLLSGPPFSVSNEEVNSHYKDIEKTQGQALTHGNITSKVGVGSYSYDAGNAGPHAVTLAGGNSYVYDNNGNITSGGGRTVIHHSASPTI